MTKKETYILEIKCGNCGTLQKIEIPKGTAQWDYEKICNYCGCNITTGESIDVKS